MLKKDSPEGPVPSQAMTAESRTRRTTASSRRKGDAPPRVPRAQRTKEIQARIDTAAMELLVSSGVDGLALTKIAAAAGMSNGPLYGRYDSGEDIALELWEGGICAHGARLTSEIADFLFGSDGEMSQWLVDELTEPSPQTIGHAEIVAVARRMPLLSESVRDELDARFRRLAEAYPDPPISLRSIAATFPIGFAMHRDLLPGGARRWVDALTVCRRFVTDRSIWDLPDRDVDPLTLEMPTPETGDPILDEFVDAVMRVVSKVGYERTTAHRVARAAGHSFSSAYSHVGSKDELMVFAIGATIAQTVTIGDVSFLHLQGEAYVDRVCALWRALVSDDCRSLRQLRVETFLAAAHHSELGEQLRASFDRSIEFLPELLGGVGDPGLVDHVMVFWHLTRAVGLGQVAVSLDSPVLRDINWSPIATGAMRLANEVLYDRLPDRG